jgi:transposase
MAYRYGDRDQRVLLPPSIDEYVSQDAPVRAYDTIIDLLDPADLGLELNPSKTGSPQYDPITMLKVLIYGYSYGVRSSRKLERELHYNLAFIWLAGGLKPDHKTIAEFRRHHKKVLANVLKATARLCIKLDLIDGNTLFIDGSKLRGHAGISKTWTEKRCMRALESIDKRIEEILTECEQTDTEEAAAGSLVHLKEELADKQQRKANVQAILQTLNDDPQRHFYNTTDPDCVTVCGRQGTHAGYNGQIAVDEKNGLIISAEAVNESNDARQLSQQVNNANAVLPEPCQTACGDSGYNSLECMQAVEQAGIEVVVPTPRQAEGKTPGPFEAVHFRYDPQADCFTCPAGQVLCFSYHEPHRRRTVYKAKPSVCRACMHWGTCTKAKEGRKVTRLDLEEFRQRMEAHYDSPRGQAVYALRKEKAELPFGHFKYNLGFSGFLLRGLEGVNAEFGLLTACFNIARMLTLFGIPRLMKG